MWSSSGESKGLTATDLGVEEEGSEAGLEGELMSAYLIWILVLPARIG